MPSDSAGTGTLARLWRDRVAPGSIETAVRQSFERCRDAHVKTVVGVLAERSARDVLRRMVDT